MSMSCWSFPVPPRVSDPRCGKLDNTAAEDPTAGLFLISSNSDGGRPGEKSCSTSPRSTLSSSSESVKPDMSLTVSILSDESDSFPEDSGLPSEFGTSKPALGGEGLFGEPLTF